MTIIFASHNLHKLNEVRDLLPATINILSLEDIGFAKEIDETESTIEGNALLKARVIAKETGRPCFSDDSGLIVHALNGAPGVLSARYAGPEKNDRANIARLLAELKNSSDRRAHFKTVIALVLAEREYLFEGIVEGKIIDAERGSNGFGYDPVFVPNGYDQTFAEMNRALKNSLSHRGMALKKLIEFLKETEF